MTSELTIQRAVANDAAEIAVMVGELLAEIMATIGNQAFNFDLAETTARLKDFLNREKYFVFVARDGNNKPAGFIALYESFALYAEGAFGTIPELYVRPEFRSNKLGLRLVCIRNPEVTERILTHLHGKAVVYLRCCLLA